MIKIRDCMKRNVFSIHRDATIAQAALLLAERHIGTLPVVDDNNHLEGVIQMKDLIGLIMPDFVRLLNDFDFVHDFGALELQEPPPELLSQPVHQVMRPPICVEETCGLLRAMAILRHHDLHDILVVSSGNILAGIASRVDIGVALLSKWNIESRGTI
jgi:CBS-domain-containing membrane protein